MDTVLTFTWGYILPFLFVITIVVFFHELGHFWVARKCGVRVEVFSIGFGRSLKSWRDKYGTMWKIGWMPLGGYVKFYGDRGASSSPDREKLKAAAQSEQTDVFHFKPLWQRTAIVAAGPLANFLLAIVLFAGIFSIVGEKIYTPVIDVVAEDSAAYEAGFEPGDIILTLDGEKIENFSQVRRLVTVNPQREIMFEIERGGVIFNLPATPRLIEETDRFGNVNRVGRLGITSRTDPLRTEHRRYHIFAAIGKGVGETIFIIEQTFVSLGRIIMGSETADALGGPIRIAQISGQMASLGLIALVNLTAIVSVSIGLINLFPVPMLDGGHLLFYAYEAIFGRPLPEKAQEIGMRIGLALVLMLFVFVTWNDLTQPNLFN